MGAFSAASVRIDPDRQRRRGLERFAWLPAPLLLAAIIAARAAGLSESYQNETLRLVLSFTFYTLVSLGTLFLIGRSFLTSGSRGLLLLECGVVLWSLAGTVGDFVDRGDANINVTIFNTGILLAGLCHLAGAVLALRPQRSLPAKPLWLGAGCALALGSLGLVTWAAMAGWLPVFFIPGQGGTMVRYCVLISATAMFVLSAVLLYASERASRPPFTSWYCLALLLLAVGLFGIMIQLSLWSVVNWLSRVAQWLGGFYLLLAAIAALRESNQPLLPLGEKSRPALYRDAMAVVTVLAAAALRLVFLSALGTHAPFVVFYPAVIVAALYGGRRAGLLATALSALVAEYFWIEPAGFSIGQPADWLALAVFVVSCTIISFISEAIHLARTRTAAAEEQAKHATERADAAEALRQSEERLALAASGTRIGMFDWNIATGEVAGTEQLTRLLGLETTTTTTTTTTLSQSYHYRDWTERVHPDDLRRMEAEIRHSLTDHTPYEAEYRIVWPDRSERWIGIRGVSQYDADGQPQRMLGIVMDITERKQAEAAVRRSEARWNAAIEHFGEGAIIATDAEQVIYWNPAARAMHGFTSPEEGIGPLKDTPNMFQLWTPDGSRLLPLEEWPMRRIKRGEIVRHVELRLRRPDQGWERIVSYSGAMVETASGERLIYLSVHDLTEQRKAEEALAAAKQAAEAANVAKSQFLANMSHELRTPMNAILGMIDVALPKAVDPTVQDCLQTVKGSADILLTLLNDLLDSARIESGKLELESAPFSLRRMLDQITRILSVRASEKGLAFYCRMPDETPDAVIGDRMRLERVLLNLAGNAIKFTERGEVEISLHVSPRPLAGEGQGVRAAEQSPHPNPPPEGEGTAGLEFAVRDTGIGIPPSSLEHLFQPFAQADVSMARRFGGTGLGLSISKSLVEMMDGRIWVESELGKGSTFCFTVRLPLAKELPPNFEAPVAVPTAACAQLRILLVEDNPANQKLATYILQDRGHVVEIAGDGQEAIYLTEQHRYDVILMDVQMPGMDGLEATAAIRKREDGGSRVPIIAMTAHAMKGDRDRCLAAGMDGYLSKPVNAQEMITLVESLARGVAPVTQATAATPTSAEASSQATALPFNREEALVRCFDSSEMVQEMIRCFFDEVDKLFPQMRVALDKGDLAEVGRLGHRVKGTAVYLGAQPVEEAALRVERFCVASGGTATEAEEAVNALEHECMVLKDVLSEHTLAADRAESD